MADMEALVGVLPDDKGVCILVATTKFERVDSRRSRGEQGTVLLFEIRTLVTIQKSEPLLLLLVRQKQQQRPHKSNEVSVRPQVSVRPP